MVKRLNAQIATQAMLLQMALSTIPNERVKPASTKDRTKAFGKVVTDLIGDTNGG